MTVKTGIVRLTSPYLNAINDPVPGASAPGYQGQPPQYAGLVGSVMELNASEALTFSNTTIGTLYGGVYQYVQLAASITQAVAVGAPLYWSNFDTHVVTTDHVTGNGSFAGVLIGLPSVGNYFWMLIQGKVAAKSTASVTTTGVAGGALSLKAATDDGFDYNSAALTGANIHLTVGQWIQAPAAGATLYLAYVGGQNLISAGFFN